MDILLKNNYKKVILIILLLLGVAYQNNWLHETATSEINLNESENQQLQLISPSHKSAKKAKKPIIVHLAGAVNKPGVYSLPAEARLVDLIELAGGMTAQADLAQVNLAQDLRDSEKVIIPVLPQLDLDTGRKEVALIAANPDQTSTNQPLININQASQAELEKLSGIGPSKAAAILKYRKQQGKFSDKNDLLNISGIGEKTLANIIDEICL